MIPEIINSSHGRNFNNYSGSILKDSEVKDNCTIGNFSRVYSSKLNRNVRIDRNNLILHSDLGDYTYTGQFSVIMHCKIGKYCSVSWGVTIGAGEHDYNKITTHDFLYNQSYDINNNKTAYDRFEKTLVLGNDVWIGTNATICRGVSIGDGAVIGANAVVTKDVPPYSIVVGSPAKIIKYRFDNRTIELLLELKWWDLPPNVIKDKFDIISSSNIEDIINELNLEK